MSHGKVPLLSYEWPIRNACNAVVEQNLKFSIENNTEIEWLLIYENNPLLTTRVPTTSAGARRRVRHIEIIDPNTGQLIQNSSGMFGSNSLFQDPPIFGSLETVSKSASTEVNPQMIENRWASLYIKSSTAIENQHLKVTFSILKCAEKMFSRCIILPDKIFTGKKYGFKAFIHSSEINNFVVGSDSTLTILCEIGQIDKNNEKNEITHFGNFVQKFESFMDNEKYSDITIYVQGIKFVAHKIILASKIPHFDAMFSYEMKENSTNEVTLDEEYVDYETFREILRYIYTGEVLNLKNLVHKIFTAAHYFQINDLLRRCEQFLRKNLSLENIADVLMLADTYDAKDLKKHSLRFITANFQKIVKSNVLQSLAVSHAHLLIEILNLIGSQFSLHEKINTHSVKIQ